MATKSKLQQAFAIIEPSATGVVFYVVLSALGIALNQFSYIKQYLELPHDLEITKTVAGALSRFLNAVIGESRTETLVVGAFWALVGLAVYLFLRGLSRLFVELDDDVDVRHYVWPRGTDRYAPLKMFVEQVVFRLVALVLLVIVIFGPLANVLRGPVFTHYVGSVPVMRYLVWFVAGVLVWHLATVLARLVALRARLFG